MLGGIFLYSTSVHEIHYLFIKHHAELHEHCDNHLHAQDKHTDCNFCKLDLSSFVQPFNQHEEAPQLFLTAQNSFYAPEVIISNDFFRITARGPPAIA